MADTYEGILEGDRIRWIGPRPPSGKVRVIPAADESARLPPLPESTPEQRARLVQALEAAAELDPYREIEDPVAWQREIRKDRPLPGRED